MDLVSNSFDAPPLQDSHVFDKVATLGLRVDLHTLSGTINRHSEAKVKKGIFHSPFIFYLYTLFTFHIHRRSISESRRAREVIPEKLNTRD